MSERVLTTVEDGIADVCLNRPEKRNALDPPMFRALVETGLALRRDRSVRVVVLRGAGKAFCAGLDFGSFSQMAEGELGDDGGGSVLQRSSESPANAAQRAAYIWAELEVPVIAAVHGVAFGGGLQIALGADIRLVAPDAQLSVMELKWGLIPDMAGTQRLRHLVRLDVAKELVYTARVVAGAEAAELGLATRVAADPLAAARELAAEIAGRSPEAIRAAKRLLDRSVEVDTRTGLELEEELQRTLIGSPNQVEAVRANFEKRPPVFADPA